MSSGAQIIKDSDSVVSARKNFDSYWQVLHDYFYIEAKNINKTYYPGTELDFDYLYDTNSLDSADVLASGFTNYLTPPTSRWFGLRTRDPRNMESKRVSTWLKDTEAEVYHALQRSNFYDQIPVFYKNSGVYGTASLLEEEDTEDGVRFYSLPLKQLGLVEDARGRIAENYIEFEYTAHEAMSRFGADKLSREINEEYHSGHKPDKKYKFILYIGKRGIYDPRKEDKTNMPYEATWVEHATKKVIEEGGYQEDPMMTHRFYKRPGIAWGFAPAMKALADVRWLNAMSKTILRSAMKISDPPIALPNSAFLLPLNMNPRALNYYNTNKLRSKDDIFEFGNKGNVNVNFEMIKYRTERIRSLMFTDVFLAFEGLTKQMTVPEVMERVNEKMTLLGPAVGRHISDVLDKVIHRTMGILMRQGKLPPLPDELVRDPSYEIEYVSALARAQKQTEFNSTQQALAMVANISQYKPQVLDKIDGDKAVDVIWGITGADISILRDEEEVQKVREIKMQEQAMIEEAQAATVAADLRNKESQTEKNLADAQSKMGLK